MSDEQIYLWLIKFHFVMYLIILSEPHFIAPWFQKFLVVARCPRNKTTRNLSHQGNFIVAFGADSFIVKPDKEVYGDEGSNVTLEWQFHVGHWSSSPTNYKVSEFLFGVWEPRGFVRSKILAVYENNVVVKQKEFERKVDWSGNISDCVSCKASIKMYNLTHADFKTYGVEVEPSSLDRNPLTNWVKLVKFVPAKIIKWLPRIEVEEGSSTTMECKATGSPTPSVMIKRKNQTLPCNSTGPGYCVYEISAANKPVHGGEYLCLVQQKSSRQILKRSLKLKVVMVEKRKTPTIFTADNRPTSNTKQDGHTHMSEEIKAMIAILLVIMTVAVCFSVCLRLFCKFKMKPEQEKPRIASLKDPCTINLNEESNSLSEVKGEAECEPMMMLSRELLNCGWNNSSSMMTDRACTLNTPTPM